MCACEYGNETRKGLVFRDQTRPSLFNREVSKWTAVINVSGTQLLTTVMDQYTYIYIATKDDSNRL